MASSEYSSSACSSTTPCWRERWCWLVPSKGLPPRQRPTTRRRLRTGTRRPREVCHETLGSVLDRFPDLLPWLRLHPDRFDAAGTTSTPRMDVLAARIAAVHVLPLRTCRAVSTDMRPDWWDQRNRLINPGIAGRR